MYENICRLCLSEGAIVKIFENIKIDVFTIIERCCPISILQNDGFPQNICKKCLKTLGVCDNFLMKCIESDKQLKESNITMQVGYIKVETTENDNYMNDDDCLEDQYMENDFKDIKVTDDIEDVKPKMEDIKLQSCEENVEKVNKVNHESKKTKLVKCDICNKTMRQKNLPNHLYTHAEENCFQCDFCPKTFKVPRYLWKHLKIHHPECSSCEICKKSFITKNALKEHMDMSHSNFVCDICKAVFNKRSLLVRHLQTHKRKKTNVSNKQFMAKKKSSISHLKNHTIENKERNGACFKDTKKSKKRIKASSKKCKPTFCTICGKFILGGINRHIDRHNNEKKFVCTYCTQAFSVKDDLNRHLKRHSINQYICDYCKKFYAQKYSLREHIISIHMNIYKKDYQCDLCLKIFTKAHALKKHRWTHTREKTYSCKYCEKSFASTKSRLEHERLHLGIKPYKCPCCSKAFTQLSNMKSHFKYNHRDIVLSDVYKANRPGPKLMQIIPETDIQVTQFETIENCSDLT